MKKIQKFIHYLILMGAVYHGVKTGANDGVIKGLLAFFMCIFLYFVIYRLLLGPRDLTFGYKNGYRPAVFTEKKTYLAGSLQIDGFDRNRSNDINDINHRF